MTVKVRLLGPGLAFIAYPEGIAMMPLAPFWSVLFFVMLFTLGVDSQFGMLETGVTALVDEFRVLRRGRRKVVVVAVVCLVLFILGLPQCSPVSHTSNKAVDDSRLQPRHPRAQRTVRLHGQTALCTVRLTARDISQQKTTQRGAELKH